MTTEPSETAADDGATAEPAPAPVDAGPKMAHEAWAERLGYLPRFNVIPGKPGRGGRAASKKPNPKYGDYAEAKAGAGWITNTEVTQAEFEQAIADSKSRVFR